MIIEIIIILTLVLGILSGYRKGLLMSLMGFAVLVLCCLGASVAQDMFAEQAIAKIEPKVQASVALELQEQVEAGTRDAVEQAGENGFTIGDKEFTLGGIMDLLEKFGLDVEESITEGAAEALSPAVEAAAAAATRTIVRPLVELVIYVTAFVILYLVLHTVMLAVNVIFVPALGYRACAWGGFAGYGTAMTISYLIGRKRYPVPYDITSIGLSLALTAVVLSLYNLLPENLLISCALMLLYCVPIIILIIKKKH